MMDDALFDPGQFQAELAIKSSPIAAFKKAIRQADTVLAQRFEDGRDIHQLIHERAWFTDQILQQAWARLPCAGDPGIALLAVGGYGRGELHPHSDIDLLILLRGDVEPFREAIEAFLLLLWDIGLEVGQSVRSVEECQQEAAADITVITNLMESRTLAGDEALRQDMMAAIDTSHMWNDAEFFRAKRAEQQARHAKFNDTEYNLEPNVKAPPAGCATFRPSAGSPCGTLAPTTCANWSSRAF